MRAVVVLTLFSPICGLDNGANYIRKLAEQLYDEMYQWREAHPAASLDEIIRQAALRRRQLMALWVEQLAGQHGTGEGAEELRCETCGGAWVYKGRTRRRVEHIEAEVDLNRAYWYCPTAKVGFFPLDRRLQLGKHSWTPDMIKSMIHLSVEIPSYARAAACFERLTNMPVSRSSLQRTVVECGTQLVDLQAAEATATTEPPPQFDEASFRHVPEPDSELMAVCLDGAFINLRVEGWKEVKVATLSAVESAWGAGGEAGQTQLSGGAVGCGDLWSAAMGRGVPPRTRESPAPGVRQRWGVVDLGDCGHVLRPLHRNSGLVACRGEVVDQRQPAVWAGQ